MSNPRAIAKRTLVGAILGAFVVVSASTAGAEDLPFVDGVMWKKSAKVLKRAYIIGLANLMTAEYLYQQEVGPPPDHLTAIPRLYEEIDDETLDGSIGRIDAWYEKNPDKLDTAVISVIWLDMVEPNLPPSRDYDRGRSPEK